VEPLADDDAVVGPIEVREQRAKEPLRSILVHFYVVGVVGAHQIVDYDHVAAEPGNDPSAETARRHPFAVVSKRISVDFDPLNLVCGNVF
jgi:hypothetical protein